MTEAENPAPARTEPAGTHLLGLLLAALSALLLLLALTALNWLSSGGVTTSDGKADSSFTGIRTLLRIADATQTAYPHFVAHQYFTWGAWVLLALAVVPAALGNAAAASGRNGRPAGLVAVVAGLLGVALTFVAIDLIGASGTTRVPGYGDYIGHVGPAFFCAVAGFLVAAFAGAAAARRPLPSPETDVAEPAATEQDSTPD